MNFRKIPVAIIICVLILGGLGAAFTVSKFRENGKASATHPHNSHEDQHDSKTGHHDDTEPSDNEGEGTDLSSQTSVNIEIKDFAYHAKNIKIKKDTRVTWTNQDTMGHNVMGAHDNSDAPHKEIDRSQIKEDILAGPLLNKGESYSFVFTEAGTFTYHCSPHPYMTGSVMVTE